jgi:DNA-binding NarL/FixJ family response regulator
MIVEDEEVVREGLSTLLSYHKELEIVGQACNGVQGCALAREVKPDVILMDVHMPECDGITATEIIVRENPSIKVVMLTSFDQDELIIKALKAGACGYLTKDSKADRIASGIQTVFGGGILLGATSALKVVARIDSPPPRKSAMQLEEKLSERKIEVLKLVGQGKSNSEIADILFISEGTVKNYVSQIFEQLGLRDRVQAALIAQQELL